MMKKLDTTPHTFAPAKAVEIAAAMQAGEEDGWTYMVRHDPTGRGQTLIDIFDEDGEKVGTV